ncbi:unnamed protein product [Linum tenue]|uniref:Uncharacterized protein n=1 Tax=Linum tenue TaxID=586396 RepID=A0AAV0S1W1_9ROSI|nr:unnamed protein product [Linum tenue]
MHLCESKSETLVDCPKLRQDRRPGADFTTESPQPISIMISKTTSSRSNARTTLCRTICVQFQQPVGGGVHPTICSCLRSCFPASVVISAASQVTIHSLAFSVI